MAKCTWMMCITSFSESEIFSIFQILFQMSIFSSSLEPTSKAQTKDDDTAALHQ